MLRVEVEEVDRVIRARCERLERVVLVVDGVANEAVWLDEVTNECFAQCERFQDEVAFARLVEIQLDWILPAYVNDDFVANWV